MSGWADIVFNTYLKSIFCSFFYRCFEHYVFTAPEKTWFDKYGRKTGFIFYILRYFLLLNWGQCLNVTEAEFLALVVTAFGASKESAWQELRVCPDPRCLTIAALFQVRQRICHRRLLISESTLRYTILVYTMSAMLSFYIHPQPYI